MSPVATDRQIGADIEFAVRRLGAQAGDAAVLLDQIGRLRFHPQIESRISLAVRRRGN